MTYTNFTLKQLGEGYEYHAQQDCKISQRMANEIIQELIKRKGQRAAKIRAAFNLYTDSHNSELWIYDDADFCEPICVIDKNKEVKNVSAPDWLSCALEYLA